MLVKVVPELCRPDLRETSVSLFKMAIISGYTMMLNNLNPLTGEDAS